MQANACHLCPQDMAASAEALAQADQADWEAAAAGQWPFLRLADELCTDLLDPAWGRRHGAAVGLREILRSHAAAACVTAALDPAPSGVQTDACTASGCNAMQVVLLQLSTWLPISHESHYCSYIFVGWMAAEGQGKPRLAALPPDAASAAAAANVSWIEDCIVRTVCVLALDRFADYVSDQVLYP